MTTSEEVLPALRGSTHFEDCCGGFVTPFLDDWRSDALRYSGSGRQIDYRPLTEIMNTEHIPYPDEIVFEVYDDDE